MTLEDYRIELEKLIKELQQEMSVELESPMDVMRALKIAHCHRKQGMIQNEIDAVNEMKSGYDLPFRFAELLKTLDEVGT